MNKVSGKNMAYGQMHAAAFIVLTSLLLNSCSTLAQTEIVLSSRWFHPRDAKDTFSTIQMVKEFGVTRVDWMYCTDKKQLEQLQNLHIPYSLAINPQTPDSAGYTTVKTRVLDINGKPLTAPWMKSWDIKNPYWGCVNNPLFKELFYRNTKNLVDLGAYGIFVDDARFNDHAREWGGCYCTYCVAAFTKFLDTKKAGVNNNFNYRNYVLGHADDKDSLSTGLKKYFKEFQTQSVVEFLTGWKKNLTDYAKRPLKFLTNNYNGNWESPVYNVFDGGIAEIPTDRIFEADRIAAVIKKAKESGKSQVFSYVTNSVDANISFILFSYLSGAPSLIPWDALVTEDVQNNYKKRYYSNTGSYLELFSFIKNNKGLFTSNQGVVFKNIKVTAPGTYQTFIRKNKKNYYLFICSNNVKKDNQGGEVNLEILSDKEISGLSQVLQQSGSAKIIKTGKNKWTIHAETAIIKLGSL